MSVHQSDSFDDPDSMSTSKLIQMQLQIFRLELCTGLIVIVTVTLLDWRDWKQMGEGTFCVLTGV